MSDRFAVERVQHGRADVVLLSLLVLLAGLGIVFMFSSSYFYGEKLAGDPYLFLKKHAVHLMVGAVLAYLVSRIPVEGIRKLTLPLLIGSFALLICTFIPGIGSAAMGAQRWIVIFGQSFQPSELVKFSLVLYLAHILSKKADRMDDLINTVLPPLVVVIIFVSLVYLQNDFSTAFFILAISFSLFFIAGVRITFFLFLGTAAIPLSIILLLTKEHRVQRIISFLNPQVDPVGAGYQLIASRSALMRGGLWGTGIGYGTKKLGGLPEAHSDFVFAVLGEEVGFIGVAFILSIFVVFAVRGYLVCVGSTTRFAYLLAFGITTTILAQTLFNIAVVSGLVPATGIPLPFFSTGGSSAIVTLVMCGVLINLSRYTSMTEASDAISGGRR
jgi:cell division protein FtsW